MYNGKKVVVTMTSWTKRIGNCRRVIQSILDNTVKPDIVFLNLSVQEFPKKMDALPKDLVELAQKNPIVRINWVDGLNTKSMKKVFPILKYLDDDDIIITCDDDFKIPKDFVKIRIDEFLQYDGKYAISSSNKPEWHYRQINGIRYWSIGSGSLFSKKMLNNHEKSVTQELISTYNDDVIYALLILSNGFWIQPTKQLSNQSGIGPRKIQYYQDSIGMTRTKAYSSNIQGIINKFEISFNSWSEIKFLDCVRNAVRIGRMNLVIFDSTCVAGDNGEYFYRKVRDMYPNMRLTFLLSNESKDWDRLKKDGFNLYPINGTRVPTLLDNASFILWSKDASVNREKLRQNRHKSIFLGHGITSTISNDDFYFIGCLSKLAKYICCTSKQECNIVNSYSRESMIPILTGFPRHDFLLNKYQIFRERNQGTKSVFISFHWRPGELDKNVETFKSSQYLQKINELLNSEKLKEIANSGVDVIFYPHARFIKYLRYFNIPKYIQVGLNKQFQDLLVESDVLITDFSSNSFEMAYMGKKTIHFVPDREYVKINMKQYHMENVSKYPHMIECNDVNSVFETLSNLLEFNQHEELSTMFAYNDQNNSKRLIEAMMSVIRYESEVQTQKTKQTTIPIKKAYVSSSALGKKVNNIQQKNNSTTWSTKILPIYENSKFHFY